MVKPDLKINAITKIEASFVKKKKKKGGVIFGITTGDFIVLEIK